MSKEARLIEYAFYLLGRRRYTVKEIEKKLNEYLKKHKNVFEKSKEWKEKLDNGTSYEDLSSSLKTEVLEKLIGMDYLNDGKYAEDFIDERSRIRPRGAFLLRRELKSKGVDEEIINRVLDESDIDEFELAIKVLSKKISQWSKYEKSKQVNKAFFYLSSKGFKKDAIYRAVNSCYNL